MKLIKLISEAVNKKAIAYYKYKTPSGNKAMEYYIDLSNAFNELLDSLIKYADDILEKATEINRVEKQLNNEDTQLALIRLDVSGNNWYNDKKGKVFLVRQCGENELKHRILRHAENDDPDKWWIVSEGIYEGYGILKSHCILIER